MARLPTTIIVAVLMTLICIGGEGKVVNKRDIEIVHTDDPAGWLCQNLPMMASYLVTCPTTTTAIPTTTPAQSATSPSVTDSSSTTSSTTSTTQGSGSNSSPVSTLQRAHWCRLSNGSYLPLGYAFLNAPCGLCQCVQSRSISCTTLQCMNTYCIDNSTPQRRNGQCCTQCSYDNCSSPCVQNGITFPHGTIIASTTSNVLCWCQLGTVECRKMAVTTTSSTDTWGQGGTIYVIIAIICIIVILGTLLCCGCAIFYYYYYQRNQQSLQQAYDQYYNTAGWQPMGEDGQVGDISAEQKQAEAEQNQFEQVYPTGDSQEYIPPPYAIYNGSYPTEDHGKDQKYM
jgi:hypothetical protein